MKGTVKWFNAQKGFGFIAGDDGTDYFVHVSQVPTGEILKENQEVVFDAAQTDRGAQAKNLRT